MDLTQPLSEPALRPKRGRARWLRLFGCLSLLLSLPLVGLGICEGQASRSLEARRAALREEIAALRARAAEPRPGLLGSGAEGNAAVDYNGVRVALAGGLAGTPEDWRDREPELPAALQGVLEEIGPGPALNVLAFGDAPNWGRAPLGSLKRAALLAEFERFRPALRLLRAGLRRGRCDWGTPWEEGLAATPSFLFGRSSANLLAYEASLQPAAAALETGFEILAFAEDLERDQTLLGGMIGLAVRMIGYRSLGHTMGRSGLNASDYQRVLDVLEGQRWRDLADLLRGEAAVGQVTILSLTWRGLGDSGSQVELPAEVSTPWERKLLLLDFFRDLELAAHGARLERAVALESLPQVERRAAYRAFQDELEAQASGLGRSLLPDVGALSLHLQEIQLHSQGTRALAAAHLVRLETGAFPARLEDLASRLGTLPVDPFLDGQTLARYRLDGDSLLIYHVGRNLRDDLGALESDDRWVATRAPR